MFIIEITNQNRSKHCNAYDNHILDRGKNTVNIKFLKEYKNATSNGHINTDSTYKHSINHKKYFNKDFFEKFLKIIDKITAPTINLSMLNIVHPINIFDKRRNIFF